MIDKSIRKLVCYGLEKGFFTKRDEIYVTNRIMEVLELDGIDCTDCFTDIDLTEVLDEILDFAAQKGLFEDGITARDLFDTKLIGAMLPRPSEVTHEFYERYKGLTDALLDNDKMFGLCYTQLTNVEQEQNGLYTYDRKPKFPPEVIRAINAQKAACEE